jgi:hypothetical protein
MMWNIVRILGVGVWCAVLLASSCPRQQELRSDRVPDDALRVTLRTGEHVFFEGDRVIVTLMEIRHGGEFAYVKIRLDVGEEVVESRVTATRQGDLTQAVRLDPYSIRVEGYPGVDSATLVIVDESVE